MTKNTVMVNFIGQMVALIRETGWKADKRVKADSLVAMVRKERVFGDLEVRLSGKVTQRLQVEMIQV